MSTKRILAANPLIDQFVAQDFPEVEEHIGEMIFKKVKVIECLDNHREYDCSYFTVEVIKDFYGYISFILTGESDQKNDVWIMRTHDFNRAYNLKNKLDALVGRAPSKYQCIPCHGSLQREKFRSEER